MTMLHNMSLQISTLHNIIDSISLLSHILHVVRILHVLRVLRALHVLCLAHVLVVLHVLRVLRWAPSWYLAKLVPGSRRPATTRTGRGQGAYGEQCDSHVHPAPSPQAHAGTPLAWTLARNCDFTRAASRHCGLERKGAKH